MSEEVAAAPVFCRGCSQHVYDIPRAREIEQQILAGESPVSSPTDVVPARDDVPQPVSGDAIKCPLCGAPGLGYAMGPRSMLMAALQRLEEAS